MSSYVLRTRLESLARIYKDRIESVGRHCKRVSQLTASKARNQECQKQGLGYRKSCSGITDTKKSSDELSIVPELRHYGALSVTRVPYRIVDLAHVKDRSQATLRRKSFHHELMHRLT